MERNNKGQFIKGTNGDVFEGFGKWYDKFGYPSIWVNNKSIMVHVFVWERANGERPSGYHVHHIDGDKGNYKLSNLDCISPSDHQRIHAGWIRNENGEWVKKPCKTCGKFLSLESFHPRNGLSPLNHCKKCSSKNHKEKLKSDPEYRERKRLYLKEYYRKHKKSILKKQKNERDKQKKQ